MNRIICNENKIRLDNFISNKLNISRTKASELIKSKLILVNGNKPSKSGLILSENDEIQIEEKSEEVLDRITSTNTPYNHEIDVVYEDEYLMVVNKENNMLCHPTHFNENDTLVNALCYYFSKQKKEVNFGIVHRLDKQTTGLMLVAKDIKTLKILQKMVSNKEVDRRYLALVKNHFNVNHLMLKLPISRINDSSKMRVSEDKRAKESTTEVLLIKNLKENMSLIECVLHTGRTHQIRVHLAYINHPVFNDEVYGKNDGYSSYGQFLHSHKLSFSHPITNEFLTFEKSADKTFDFLLKKLGIKDE